MLAEWHDFFVTAATCAATLTGFITVAVSINLKTIVAHPQLPDKALASIILLLLVMLVGLLGLLPGQAITLFGWEMLGLGTFSWGSLWWLGNRTLHEVPPQKRRLQTGYVFLTQAATFCYLVSGALLVSGRLGGCYWLVPAMLLSLCKTTLDAWILLIEVHR